MRRIYLDVDDTLALFRQHAIANGVPAWEGSWYTAPREGWTDEQKFIQDKTNELMRTEDFWMTMPVAPLAHEVIAAASFHGPVELLTAVPSSLLHEVDTINMIRRAKVRYAWQALHVPPERILVVDRRDKVRYAWNHFDNVQNVLVDDAIDTCNAWANQGGLAFHLEHVEDGLHEALNFIKCL
jgi:hypothetical protein